MAKVSSSISGGITLKDNGLPSNKTNMQKKGDYGVRVAKWGYDAGSCEDGDLLFNSNWPIVQLAKYIRPDAKWEDVEMPNPPSDKPYDSPDEYDTAETIVGVDRKYCYTCDGGTIWQYHTVEYDEWGNEIWTFHNFVKPRLKRHRHNLGYTPMPISSETLGGEPGGVVLTNIDITKDVDYPYVSKPRLASSRVADYGISSKAYYAGKLNMHNKRYMGLSSSIQSLQVQSVKTWKTVAKKGWGDDIAPNSRGSVYYPPTNNGQYIFSAGELTYFGFLGGMMGVGAPNILVDNAYSDSNLGEDINFGYGDVLFSCNVYGAYGGAYVSGVLVGFVDDVYDDTLPKTSLVALRCPMVSPDIIEVEI